MFHIAISGILQIHAFDSKFSVFQYWLYFLNLNKGKFAYYMSIFIYLESKIVLTQKVEIQYTTSVYIALLYNYYK